MTYPGVKFGARTKISMRQTTASKRPAAQKSKSKSKSPAKKQPGVKKPRRFRPGVQALKQIRKAQVATTLMFRKRPFIRWVREIALMYNSKIRFAASALQVLQEATEEFLVGLFRKSYELTIHSSRQTLMGKDLKRVDKICQ